MLLRRALTASRALPSALTRRLLPTPVAPLAPIITPSFVLRALSTAPKSVWEAHQTAKDSSVNEARKVAFGRWPANGHDPPFKSLKRIRRGWIAEKLMRGEPEGKKSPFGGPIRARPKPNLLPPGHPPPKDDVGNFYLKHPVYRALENLTRLKELENRRLKGKSPPKKGAGKRAAKGKGKK